MVYISFSYRYNSRKKLLLRFLYLQVPPPTTNLRLQSSDLRLQTSDLRSNLRIPTFIPFTQDSLVVHSPFTPKSVLPTATIYLFFLPISPFNFTFHVSLFTFHLPPFTFQLSTLFPPPYNLRKILVIPPLNALLPYFQYR